MLAFNRSIFVPVGTPSFVKDMGVKPLKKDKTSSPSSEPKQLMGIFSFSMISSSQGGKTH